MKKVLKFIIFFTFLFNISGCVTTNPNSTTQAGDSMNKILVETQYNINNSIELDEASLIAKLAVNDNETGDDFVLYIYTPSCTACAAFKSTVLKPFIKESGAKIYSITNTLAKKHFSLGSNDASPVLMIIKNGIVTKKVGALYAEDVFASKDGLKSFLDEHVVISKMKEISSSDLDELIQSNSEIVVYFNWSECGDCLSFKVNFLNEYLLKNESENILYMLETNEWRSQKETNPEVWEDFASKYGFDSYQGGKIPSIVYYKDGVKNDMAVYLNDVMEFNETGILVSSSYYENAPFIGQTFNTYNDYKEQVKEFHNQKVKEFLEKYYE